MDQAQGEFLTTFVPNSLADDHIKVDFINTHMGIGFPVPIIMLNEDDILDGRDIACILGNAGE
jgi:hypothetical protein